MKVIITLILILSFFFVSKKTSFAQSIELAGTYTTSDANFYKNTPGVSFAYSHHFKKQFVFVELKTSKKDDASFATFYNDITGYYIIQSVNGSFSISSVNIGAAQKIVASDCLEFSVGADAGLNYYKPDFEITSVGLDKERNEITSFNTSVESEKRKNKFGIGAFIDMELKNIFFENLSVFSRLNIYHISYNEPLVRGGGSFMAVDINSIGFRVGVKYRIPKAKD
jgi:hypothetical protein